MLFQVIFTGEFELSDNEIEDNGGVEQVIRDLKAYPESYLPLDPDLASSYFTVNSVLIG